EAFALSAAAEARAGKNAEAMATGAKALALLADASARLYDAEQPEKFKESLEDFVVEMEMKNGTSAPAELDLKAARERRAELAREMKAAREEMLRRGGGGGAGPREGGAPDGGETQAARGGGGAR